MPPAVAIAILILGALLVVVLLRRPGGERAAGLIQQQLIELRAKFDHLVAAQQELPKALAQGSAEQTRVLQDVRERPSRRACCRTCASAWGSSARWRSASRPWARR